jgi:hypothetical protein
MQVSNGDKRGKGLKRLAQNVHGVQSRGPVVLAGLREASAPTHPVPAGQQSASGNVFSPFRAVRAVGSGFCQYRRYLWAYEPTEIAS